MGVAVLRVSVGGVKQVLLFFDGIRGECIFNDLLRHDAALATLTHNAQLFPNFTQVGGATENGVFNLTVGNTFAEADVHDFLLNSCDLEDE